LHANDKGGRTNVQRSHQHQHLLVILVTIILPLLKIKVTILIYDKSQCEYVVHKYTQVFIDTLAV